MACPGFLACHTDPTRASAHPTSPPAPFPRRGWGNHILHLLPGRSGTYRLQSGPTWLLGAALTWGHGHPCPHHRPGRSALRPHPRPVPPLRPPGPWRRGRRPLPRPITWLSLVALRRVKKPLAMLSGSIPAAFCSRGDRTRTCGLKVPNFARYQLCYTPSFVLYSGNAAASRWNSVGNPPRLGRTHPGSLEARHPSRSGRGTGRVRQDQVSKAGVQMLAKLIQDAANICAYLFVCEAYNAEATV